MHTQTVEAAAWWARPRGATATEWIANYQNSLKSRHRDRIVEIVQGLAPTSLLEVGCHCGPNLVRIAQACPDVALTGVDVNREAIAAGQAWVTRLGLGERIELAHGRVPDLTSTVKSGEVDVVLSCYALAYIAPPDLDAVLYEMGRLAKRAIVLAEPMTDEATSKWNGGFTGYAEWAHHYAAASRWLNTWRGMTLTTVAVDPPVDRLASILVAARD